MSPGLSRRGLFSMLRRPLRSAVDTSKAVAGSVAGKTNVPAPTAEAQAMVAVIQGRFCLAYTSFCSVCSERCPVTGAMKVEKGIPMVIADVCTGCGICHDVCPAPTNAVLVLPRRRNPRFPSPPAL